MKISEYIQHLEHVRSQIGDVEVQTAGVDGGRCEARAPEVGYVQVLKGREYKPRFWGSYQVAERKGDAVCRV